jgi:hypothetical protein
MNFKVYCLVKDENSRTKQLVPQQEVLIRSGGLAHLPNPDDGKSVYVNDNDITVFKRRMTHDVQETTETKPDFWKRLVSKLTGNPPKKNYQIHNYGGPWIVE